MFHLFLALVGYGVLRSWFSDRSGQINERTDTQGRLDRLHLSVRSSTTFTFNFFHILHAGQVRYSSKDLGRMFKLFHTFSTSFLINLFKERSWLIFFLPSLYPLLLLHLYDRGLAGKSLLLAYWHWSSSLALTLKIIRGYCAVCCHHNL